MLRSSEEIERAWQQIERSPRGQGMVRLITIRLGGGRHEQLDRVAISPELGVHGDRWAAKRKHLDAQVTLMNARVAELIAAGVVPPGASGDNFLVDLDIGEESLPAGSQVRIGGALVEITALPHTGCNKFRQRFGAAAHEWVNGPPNRALRLRGVNCRILAAGEVAVGDPVLRVDRPA